MVERLVANEKVEGSTPFARSIIITKFTSNKNVDDLLNKNCVKNVPCEGGMISPLDISRKFTNIKKK